MLIYFEHMLWKVPSRITNTVNIYFCVYSSYTDLIIVSLPAGQYIIFIQCPVHEWNSYHLLLLQYTIIQTIIYFIEKFFSYMYVPYTIICMYFHVIYSWKMSYYKYININVLYLHVIIKSKNPIFFSYQHTSRCTGTKVIIVIATQCVVPSPHHKHC